MHTRRARLAALLVALVTAAAGAPGCGRAAFVVGTEAAFPPFESVTADGSLEGFDIDLMRAVDAHLRTRQGDRGPLVEGPLEFRNMDFSALIPDLRAGRLQAVCSGLSRTEERAERVDFSRPYAQVPTGVLVSSKLIGGDDDIEALDGPDIVIAVQRKTTGEEKAAGRFPDATLRAYDREVDAAAEVDAGRAHALVYDMVSIVKLQRQYPQTTRILDSTLGVEHYAIAFSKGSPLVPVVNAFLAAESRPGGVVDRLLTKWLGEAERFRVDED